MVKVGMRRISFHAFTDELGKEASNSMYDALLRTALSKGLRPSTLPALKQVKNVAGRDPKRAAEIADNVRSYLKTYKKAG